MSEHPGGIGAALFAETQRRDRLGALGLGAAMLAVLIAAVPFAGMPLLPLGWFIPAYEGAVVVNDLVTAAVFLALFAARGEFGLLVLAAGYLWTALLAGAHLASFPGLFAFSPSIGPQTTAWLYMMWHTGFPVAVALYGIAPHRLVRRRRAALLVAGGVVAIVAALVVRSTLGDALPPLMSGPHKVPLQNIVAVGLCLLAMIALCCTIARRTVLDLWLSLAMYAWACDVMLSAVFNVGRFDFGWYAGRIFGFFAVSLVLCEVLVLTVAGGRPPSGQGADRTGR
jgi:NADH:ubiquinone oxidoreductase subunit K